MEQTRLSAFVTTLVFAAMMGTGLSAVVGGVRHDPLAAGGSGVPWRAR